MKLNHAIQTNTLKVVINVLFFGGLSSLVGLGNWANKGSFWLAASLCLFIELLGLYFIGVVSRTRAAERIRNLELEKISNLSSILSCAACNESNIITFIPDNQERVEFDCGKCGKKNVVTIQFAVAVVSSPVDSLQTPVAGIA